MKAEGDKLSGEIELAADIENDAVAEKEMAAEAEQITSKPVAEAIETVKDEEDPEADAGAIAEDDSMPVAPDAATSVPVKTGPYEAPDAAVDRVAREEDPIASAKAKAALKELHSNDSAADVETAAEKALAKT